MSETGNNDGMITLDVADRVATITLNDPGRRNIVSAALNAAIVEGMDELESRDDVGAIVVTGAPPAFCAGADLDDLAACDTEEKLRTIYSGFLRLADSPLPTIAAVNGAAVGAGLNLALACDVILAGESAKFDTRFLQIGIHPGGGHTWMLRRIAGPQTTMATVIFGEVVDGAEAERLGIVHRCVDDDQLQAVAHAMAARAASAPRELVIETKKTIQAMADVSEHVVAVERELKPQLWSTRQPWFAERIAALQNQISSKK